MVMTVITFATIVLNMTVLGNHPLCLDPNL